MHPDMLAKIFYLRSATFDFGDIQVEVTLCTNPHLTNRMWACTILAKQATGGVTLIAAQAAERSTAISPRVLELFTCQARCLQC